MPRFSWPSPAALAAAMLMLAGHALAQPSAAPLPALGLDARGVTVSGLSSGAFMAAQFQLAYSGTVAGAGVVEGGPPGCALGSVTTAMLTCSCPGPEAPANDPFGLQALSLNLTRAQCIRLPAGVLSRRAQDVAAANEAHIDPLAHLARHRVWVLAGGQDPVVHPGIVAELPPFYRAMGVPATAIRATASAQAGHGMPAPGGQACGVTAWPFLIDCQIDAAGEMLQWLYRRETLRPGTARAASLRPFDQTPYRQPGVYDGLDDTGWVYVPAACERRGARCGLHVVFHGCQQGQRAEHEGQPFGTTFVTGAGYNRWAEAARLVVLYPQVLPSQARQPGKTYQFNPKGCWDFWGYTLPQDSSLMGRRTPYLHRDAPQMRAVKAMIDALLARSTSSPTPAALPAPAPAAREDRM